MSAARHSVRAVLFDLDGTLLDTIEDLAEGANRMLAELGRPQRPLAEIHSFVGKGIPNLVRRCMTEGAHASESEIEHAIACFRRHYTEVNGAQTKIYPGVLETLDAMRSLGLKLACVTNKAKAFTGPLLARVGIDHYFDAVVSGDTLPVKKPDPAMLHYACEQMGIDSARALMIGDSANDALAARAAGMPVLLVTYGYSEGMPVEQIECDGLIDNATEALGRVLFVPSM